MNTAFQAYCSLLCQFQLAVVGLDFLRYPKVMWSNSGWLRNLSQYREM